MVRKTKYVRGKNTIFLKPFYVLPGSSHIHNIVLLYTIHYTVLYTVQYTVRYTVQNSTVSSVWVCEYCCPLQGTSAGLGIIRNTLSTLYYIYSILFTSCHTLYHLQFTPYSVSRTLYTVYRTLFNVNCAHCTLYICCTGHNLGSIGSCYN